MKFLALVPFRNESKYLDLFMKALKDQVDGFVGYNDASTDNSEEIFRANGGRLLESKVPRTQFGVGATYDVRKRLLQEGRRLGGTHFLIVDADEILVGSDRNSLRDLTFNLSPGEYLAFELLTVWNSFQKYIDGYDLRKPRKMDFIFADHKDIAYENPSNFVHFDRIPRKTSGYSASKFLEKEKISFLHLSFVNKRDAQIKQAWYRIMERDKLGRNSQMINNTYSFTIQEPTKFGELNSGAIPHFLSQDLYYDLSTKWSSSNWHLEDSVRRILTSSKWKFLNLDIWDIQELRTTFEQQFGFTPLATPLSRLIEKSWNRLSYLSSILKKLVRGK